MLLGLLTVAMAVDEVTCDFLVPSREPIVHIDKSGLLLTTREYYDAQGRLATENGRGEVTIKNISEKPVMVRMFVDMRDVEEGGFYLMRSPWANGSSVSHGKNSWFTATTLEPGESVLQEIFYFPSRGDNPGGWTLKGDVRSHLNVVVFDESGTCALSQYSVSLQAEVTDIEPGDE